MNYLVAGLGNIGSEYECTRHNSGFMVLDAWAQASNAVFSTERYGSVAVVTFRGNSFYLLKPSTYMNLSGNAVRYWISKLKLTPSSLVVIYDDINIPLGTVRMRKSGSDGGHNGLKNINELLGTTDYCRIRMGVGNGFSRGGQIDYVLGRFSDDDLKMFSLMAQRAIEGVKSFAIMGPDRAMNLTNAKIEVEKV